MYSFKKVVKNGQIKYVVIIDRKDEVIVSQEVYVYMTNEKEKARYRARRDGKCGTAAYWKCDGECDLCPYAQQGFNMIPLDFAFKASSDPDSDDEFDPVDNIPDSSTPLPDSIVADRDLLVRLMKRLDELVPDGGQIYRMLTEEYTDREMTKELHLKQQSTLNYRKKKVQAYLKEHRDEYFD